MHRGHAASAGTIPTLMALSRSPRLLWRYLASDVLGILLMACAGLVGVIAFAAAMRPLSEGRVGVFESVRLMGLLAVPMLQFALPFASGLAATLAYHRFAAENEATASMAGGISHRSILVPAFVLGLVLSVLLGLLSHQVIPRFLRSAEQLLTRDVTRFIVNPIERGETVRLGPWDLRADQVIDAGRAAPTAGGSGGSADAASHGAAEHLVLLGVLAHRVDDPSRFVEAGRVDLYLFDDAPSDGSGDDDGGTRAVLRFDQANAYVGANRLQAQGVFTDSLRIPSAFRDDPKYLDFNELRRVREHPEMLNRIEWRRRLVADHLAMRDMIGDVAAQLREKGKATLLRRGDVLTIHAADVVPVDDGWALRAASGAGKRVRVDMKLASGSTRTHTGASARLRFRDLAADQTAVANQSEGPGRVWLRIDLEDVATAGAEADGAAETRSDTLFYGALTTEKDHAAARGAETSARLIADASDLAGPVGPEKEEAPGGAALRRAARELSTKIDDLKREAVSKLHERAAFSLSCLLMTLCGGVVALRLSSALPLQVYLWSFFPALICVITISAGQGLTHKYGTPGLILLWGGVAGLGLFTMAAYASLRRH